MRGPFEAIRVWAWAEAIESPCRESALRTIRGSARVLVNHRRRIDRATGWSAYRTDRLNERGAQGTDRPSNPGGREQDAGCAIGAGRA